MLDKLPHDVLVHLARSFEVVDRVVLSEVCRACRDATREARAVDERCGVPVKLHGFAEDLWPGDKEFLSLASSSRLAWARACCGVNNRALGKASVQRGTTLSPWHTNRCLFIVRSAHCPWLEGAA